MSTTGTDRSCRDYLRMLLLTGFHKGTHPPLFWQDVQHIPDHCTMDQATATWSLVGACGIGHTFDFTRYADQHALMAALRIDIVRIDPLY